MADYSTVRIGGEAHVITQCGTCAVWHTVPEIVYVTQRREGGFHCCPNGHSRGWAKGTEEKEREAIRRERDQLRQQIACKDDEITDKSKELLRLKKRAAAGVCPCCNRTFLNMQRHMKSRHPNIVPLEQKQMHG